MLSLLAQSSFSHYAPVGLILIIAVVMPVAIITLSSLLGPRREGSVKGMTYESGMNPIGDTRRRFNVRFYIVAMTFLVFDVEIVFLYPWATVFPSLQTGSLESTVFLCRMLFFLLTSVIAFAYAWRKGVFRYD